MRYAVILNDPCPDFAGEIRRISGVIERCGLDASDAQLIRISIGHALPQTAARYIAEHFSEISMFICPSGKLGDELAVHIAEYSGGSSVTEVTGISQDQDALTVSRKVYAGHVSASFELKKKPFCVSLSPSTAESTGASPELEEAFRNAETITFEDNCLIDLVTEKLEAASDLDAADCVVIAGKGASNKKNAEEIAELAASVGLTAAGTRPCIMNGWMPTSRLIGVSGKIIRPKTAILLGVSCAPAFYEGVKNSGKIISVNNDPDAPACSRSDLVIRGDCMAVFREFTGILNQ